MEATLKNIRGDEVGKIALLPAVFGVKPSPELLHEFVTVYEANQRQFDADTKSKAEVSGSGKKPWKQKHTGRARAGDKRSPLWRHGGVVFGPRSKFVRLAIPRQKARLALAQALAARHADGAVVFVDSLSFPEAKTKLVAQALEKLGCDRGALIVLDQPDKKLSLASRNIPGVEVRLAGDLNAWSVLRSRRLVLTRAALEKLGARWS